MLPASDYGGKSFMAFGCEISSHGPPSSAALNKLAELKLQTETLKSQTPKPQLRTFVLFVKGEVVGLWDLVVTGSGYLALGFGAFG